MTNLHQQYRKLVKAPASNANLARAIHLVREIVKQGSNEDPNSWDWNDVSRLWEYGSVFGANAKWLGWLGVQRDELKARKGITRDVVTTLIFASSSARARFEGDRYSFLADS